MRIKVTQNNYKGIISQIERALDTDFYRPSDIIGS